MDAFYRELDIPVRGGRARRFYFPHATADDAFRDRFGGELLTYTPRKLWRLALKLKSKRIYAPRIVADHIMVQEDFERLHKWLAYYA